ncbi:hypothetical protein VE03_10621 [Pseudogymnoascus sp. 23342-1-I1]|nr:hypothetical protein VE03_10621 [Pseudogymnoascus sp. 23342-1-I1]
MKFAPTKYELIHLTRWNDHEAVVDNSVEVVLQVTTLPTFQVRRTSHPHQRLSREPVYGSRSLAVAESRGNEKHITPDDLEKMVITIKEEKDLEPLTMSTQPYLAPLASEATPSQFSNPNRP